MNILRRARHMRDRTSVGHSSILPTCAAQAPQVNGLPTDTQVGS